METIMTSAVKSLVFKDFDLNMKAHPVTGKLIARKNSDSIKQALKNLILTDKGERPFRPYFGSDIRMRLFDLMDPAIASNIEYDIRTAIKNYDERVEVLSVTVDGEPETNNLRVNIVFRPINTQAPSTLVLTLESVR
jgi:phage baseplate assembly protein W